MRPVPDRNGAAGLVRRRAGLKWPPRTGVRLRPHPSDEALELAARGWPVLWLRPQSKLPATAHGVKDATTDPDVIRGWAEAMPDGNIGVATGAPGPDVLDVDDPQAAADVSQKCQKLGGPVVATARGLQYYFRGTDGRTVGLGWGELRRQGSYVVAPPSVHPSGRVYTWTSSPNGATPALPDGLVPNRSSAGAGDAPAVEQVAPGAMYEYLKERALRLARAGEQDVDVVEGALLAAFELKRVPDTAYSGGARDTRRLAEWAVTSEIAERERKSDSSRFGRYRESRRPPRDTEGAKDAAVQFTRASSVRAKPVQWLIPGRVPLGGVTMLAGDPKLGKSALTCLYGAEVSRGGYGHEPGITAFASAEDTLAHVIKPRLHAAGADLDLVGTLAVHDGDDARGLQLPGDVSSLDAFVAETGARLLVIDPLNAFLVGSIDSWKDHGIRAALAPLARLAEAQLIAIIVVVHLNKQVGGNPLYRPNGSIGYAGAARSCLAFGRDPDDPDGERGKRRLLGQFGTNWGVEMPTQVYELEGVAVELDDDVIETVRLRYVGETDADAGAAFGTRATEDRGADCEEAISEQLSDLQPHPSRTVKSAVMAELDVSERTVKRAAQRMTDRGELVITRRGSAAFDRLAARAPSRAKSHYDRWRN